MSLIINDKKVAGLYKAYVIQNATNTASGIIRIATEEEVKAGLDSLTAVTPKQLATKQDVLIAGNGLEILEDGTINNTQTSAEWGNIIGNILDQEDLNAILLTKANEEETAYELVYEDSILTLKNRKGDILSTVSINELPDVDDVTIVINEENKLQSIGEKTKSGTFKYTWIGTETEYTDAKDLGIIDEFTECIIIDSEAEKVVPIVQYEAPTKLSQLANDIEYVTNDELQSVKTSLEEKIDLQTDGAEIVHKVGNETIDGFKNFKQKIVIENGLGKGRIAHKPTDTSLEDGYIEFGEDTLLYGKQNINGELYDEKHNIFHDGNLVAGDNITITEENGIYTINGEAGGGTDEPSTNVLVDDITIVKDDNDIITTVGVKSKNDTILYDWIGTENEYNIALENGTIQPNWICYITDDISHTDDIRPEIDRLDDVKANKDLSNLSEVGEKHFLNKSQITNCITEIPQRIKYTLADGTLTIKAGSVVIVPYGTEDLTAQYPKGATFLNDNFKVYDTQFEDGKFFVWTEVQNDISHTGSTVGVTTRLCSIDVSSGSVRNNAVNTSGNSAYEGTTNCKNYRTDLNLIEYYSLGTLIDKVISLPLFVITGNDTVEYGSIDQVFNGMGYIGSTIWVDKDVKGLIPNGRNEDGTLNNIEFTTSKVLIETNLNFTGTRPIRLRANDIATGGLDYDFIKNQNLSNGEYRDYVIVGEVNVSSSAITDLKVRQPFRAVDYNDASGLSMPSRKYISLTLGASDTTYIAPTSGWYYFEGGSTSGNKYASLRGTNYAVKGITISGISNVALILPVKKGEVITLTYSTNTAHTFRFIYAEGEI